MEKINEISTAMAKGFAAEMTEKMNNGMLKKGCPIMRGVLTVKSGKETEIGEGVKRVSITVKVNYPFNILKPSNRRIEVIVENGELRNVKEIMYVALDAINWIGRKIVSFTKGYWCDIDSECYPDFVPTIEKYGIEWFERSITEFYDYLTGLEYVNKAEAEEEVCDAPELNSIEDMVLDFNDYVLNTLMTDYEDAVGEAEVYAEDYGEYYTEVPHLSVTMEYDYTIKYMWANWAYRNNVMEVNDAVEYYNANVDRFITNEELDAVLEGLDGTDDVGNGECLVWAKNPYYVEQEQEVCDAPELDEIIENALESAMDDGNEYYDDKICQIGELYVSYTSPCDEFPKGCVCVVDEEGRMYGNWCNVSDSGFAVDFLVKTLDVAKEVAYEHTNMYITYDDEVGFEEPTEEEQDMTEEEQELIDDIVSTVSDEGYWYSCLEEEKAIVDKYIDTDDDLQRFEFIKEGDYYHFIATDIIEDTIFQNIIEEAGNDCVPDVSGAWYDYEDYRDYLDWDKIIDDVEGYFTDAELKDDFLYDYYNCADDIYKAVDRHMAKFDDEVKEIKLDWGELDDEVAYFMVADDEFAEHVMTNVEEWLDIEEWLVYDDGLYIKFLVDEVEEAPVQSVEDYIMDISSRPVYVKKENITIEYGSDYVEVGLFGSYFVKLYNDDVHAAAYCSEGLSWGKEDLMFAYDIMDYKSHIWAIVNENRRRLAA
jgi:hypothetical protein